MRCWLRFWNRKVLKRAQTYAFTVLGMSQLFHAVGMRDVRQSIFSQRPFENRLMLVAVGMDFCCRQR